MTLFLLAWALIGGSLGAWTLSTSRWPEHTPRLGLAAWLLLSVSLPVMFVTAAASVLTATSLGHSVIDFFHACIALVRRAFSGPVSPSGADLVAVFLLLVVARVVAQFLGDLTSSLRQRRRHRAQLRLVAATRCSTHQDDLIVVDDARPAAFCLPGRMRTIVITTTAVTRLSPEELVAVLAHERAHLRGHHHLILAWSHAIGRGYRFLPGVAAMAKKADSLVEMVADDHAVSASSPPVLASALLRLVGISAAEETIGAAEVTVAARVTRLMAGEPALKRWPLSASAAALGVLTLLPAAVSVAVWVNSVGAGYRASAKSVDRALTCAFVVVRV